MMTLAMIERHITFAVLPGRSADFQRFFTERYRPAMSVSPGYVRADLLRELDDPSRYRMILRWADAPSAAGWRTSPVHEGLQPELNALHSGSEVLALEVVAD